MTAALPSEVTPFDYSQLEFPDAAALQLVADRIRDRLADTQRSAIAIGLDLLGAKRRLQHGSFVSWVLAEFGFTPRTAQNLMNVARFVQAAPAEIHESVSRLPAATLYRLAAPTASPAVVAEVLQAAAAGDLPSPPIILRRLEEAGAESREVRQLQRSKPGRTEDQAQAVVRRNRERRERKERADKDDWAQQQAKREAAAAELTRAVQPLAVYTPNIAIEVLNAMALLGPSAFAQELRAALRAPEAAP